MSNAMLMQSRCMSVGFTAAPALFGMPCFALCIQRELRPDGAAVSISQNVRAFTVLTRDSWEVTQARPCLCVLARWFRARGVHTQSVRAAAGFSVLPGRRRSPSKCGIPGGSLGRTQIPAGLQPSMSGFGSPGLEGCPLRALRGGLKGRRRQRGAQQHYWIGFWGSEGRLMRGT